MLPLPPLPPSQPQPPAASAVQGTELPTNQFLSGKIKAFYPDKGFGFIAPDIPGPDIFLHKNQVVDAVPLSQGSTVSFQCRFNDSRRKFEAVTCQSVAVQQGAGSVGKGGVPAKGGWAVQDNLFIAGLPATATEEFIRHFFGQFAVVQQCKLLDTPGKVDKAALVRVGDDRQAKWLVDHMSGTTPPGLPQPLTVRFAGDRPGPGGLTSSPAGPAAPPPPPPPIVGARISPYGGLGTSAPVVVPPPKVYGEGLPVDLVQLLPGLVLDQRLLQSLEALKSLGQVAANDLATAGVATGALTLLPNTAGQQHPRSDVPINGSHAGIPAPAIALPIAATAGTPALGQPIGASDGAAIAASSTEAQPRLDSADPASGQPVATEP